MADPGTTTSVTPNYAGPNVNSGYTDVKGQGLVPNGISPTQQAYNQYGTALSGANYDYNDIMSRYKQLYGQLGNNNAGLNFNYNYTVPTYNTSADYKNAINNLSSLASNGGYSAQDIADLRARAIAPIRSTYANAQNDIARQKVLQGGYSPNFTAATTKMANEMSSQMADAATNANAAIAQNEAQNRIAAASPLASITEAEQGAHNQFDLSTAAMANQYGLAGLNAQIQQMEFPIQAKLNDLGGMSSLFQATPGMANMLRNQANTMAGLQAQIGQNNQNNGLAKLAAAWG